MLRVAVFCLMVSLWPRSAHAATVSAEHFVEVNPKRLTSCGPAVAWNGTHYLVVWANRKQVYSALVASDGALVVGAHLIGPAYANNLYSCPRIARGGTKALVVWHDPAGAIQGAFVDGTNTATAAFTIALVVGRRHAHPAVSFNGSSFLVMWQGTTTADWSQGQIYGRRISAAGALLGPELAVTTGVASRLGPSVAAAGSIWLVTWQDGTGTTARIRGQFLAADGSLLDGNLPISESATGGSHRNVDVASDGIGFLVTWFDGGLSGISHVRGSFVSVFGTVTTPLGFQLSDVPVANTGDAPRVAFNSATNRYLITWEPDLRASLRGAIVAPAISSATSFLIANTTAPDLFYSGAGVASGAGTSLLVTYGRAAGGPLLVFDRTVALP